MINGDLGRVLAAIEKLVDKVGEVRSDLGGEVVELRQVVHELDKNVVRHGERITALDSRLRALDSRLREAAKKPSSPKLPPAVPGTGWAFLSARFGQVSMAFGGILAVIGWAYGGRPFFDSVFQLLGSIFGP
ncbi:MAG: hypothetical protein GY719_25980 [bacterium]|nr:hypothetical protein [bacterium]